MKKTFKLMGSFLLVLFFIFGVVSCDNPTTPKDHPSLEIPKVNPGETLTKGNIETPRTDDDGNVVVECVDENGGKYIFIQTTPVQRSATAGGTWEYIVNGKVKFSGTYSGDIAVNTEVEALSLTIQKAADEDGVLKDVKKEMTFEFKVSSDNKTFVAKIPVVEIRKDEKVEHEHVAGDKWENDEEKHWKTCTSCEEKLESSVHDYEWQRDASGHWQECICGKKQDKAKHKFGEYVSNNDATTEKDGTKTRTCTVCNYIETVIDEGSKIIDAPVIPEMVLVKGGTVVGENTHTLEVCLLKVVL